MKATVSKSIEDLLRNYPALAQTKTDIMAAFEALAECFRDGGKVLVCGNGGSASDAEHIVGELMKEYLIKRPIRPEHAETIFAANGEAGKDLCEALQGGLPAISLVSHTSLTSAIANDVSSDMVYAQQVYGYGNQHDAVIGISTSGNSKSVCNAVRVANGLGMTTIGLTGSSGGALKGLCGIAICAPDSETYRIQEYHQPIYHALCAMLEEEFFGL